MHVFRWSIRSLKLLPDSILLSQQIRVAEGRPLGMSQGDVIFTGHAIECRLNAEDCQNDFQPSPGKVTRAQFPAGPGIRIDTHIESGITVPPYYDSLLGKLIVWGEDRAEAITPPATCVGAMSS